MDQRTRRRLDALKALAASGSGATEGERAAALAAIGRIEERLAQGGADGFTVDIHVEGLDRLQEALKRASERMRPHPFSGADFVRAKRRGVNVDGEWTSFGATADQAMFDALRRMQEEMIARAFGLGSYEPPIHPNCRSSSIPRTETVTTVDNARQEWGKRTGGKPDVKNEPA